MNARGEMRPDSTPRDGNPVDFLACSRSRLAAFVLSANEQAAAEG